MPETALGLLPPRVTGTSGALPGNFATGAGD